MSIFRTTNRWEFSLRDNTLQFGSSQQTCLSSNRSRFHFLAKRLATKTSLYEIIRKRVFVKEEGREIDMEFVIKKTAYRSLQMSDLLFSNHENQYGEQFLDSRGKPVDFSYRALS